MIQTYYKLAKPGIVYGNSIAAIAGFLFASKSDINPVLFLFMLLGLCLVIASACVLNNFLDRGIDAKMERTKRRALVTGSIPAKNAIIYASILGMAGFLILIFGTNLLTAFLAFVGFFFYVVLYGYTKRRSVHGTLVGSVSGAIPPVVGYCAASNRFDLGALLIFLVLLFWQMPHFYALAMYRVDDYKASHIPVLPAVHGSNNTKKQIIFYIILFCAAIISFKIFKLAGYTFLLIMLTVSLAWLVISLKGFNADNTKLWGKMMFRFSLIILLIFCVTLSVTTLLSLP